MAKQQTEEEKKAAEVVGQIAKNIEDLAKGVRAVLAGRLNERAIILLVASAAGKMPQDDVKKVIDAIATLDKKYLK